MRVYIAGFIGFFIGMFFGAFLLGVMQMIREGDKIYENAILERRRKISEGKFCKPDDYFNHFKPDRRGSFRAVSSGKSGKTGHPDNRVLHNEHGHLEL